MNPRLLQLGDSALPIGGYRHSWGREAAVERGVVHDLWRLPTRNAAENDIPGM
jgi:urease accessory protein UreF